MKIVVFGRFATAICVTVVLLTPASIGQGTIRTIDGTNNNIANPAWGSAGITLERLAPNDYADGMSAPSGANRPGGRAISNAVCAQPGSIPSVLPVSDLVWQWGQFVDHDLDLTGSASPAEPFPIPVPMGDPFFDPNFTGTQTIGLNRSAHTNPITPQNPREQINDVTAWIDGSMVYGSDNARALALRTLDGTGMLKTSAGNLLPFNTGGLPNGPTANDPTFFVAGDVRANEQVGLTAMHTLFVREHNTIAQAIGTYHPDLDDEQRYQAARAIVIGEIQAITYKEWLPVLLGPNPLPPYQGYNSSVSPNVKNEFSTAAFRVGHTLLSQVLQRLDGYLHPIPQGPLPLANAFFNPSAIINEGGIDPVLRGLAKQRAQEVDTMIVGAVRNFLFGPPGSGGLDLASLNIQRGRDHGIPSYNVMRVQMGFPAANGFGDVSSDPMVQQRLASVYASVNDIDLWVGALAEDHVPGAIVGPLIRSIVADQFRRARDGDRFWYQIYLGGFVLGWVETQSLAKVIQRNTGIGNELQPHVFIAPTP